MNPRSLRFAFVLLCVCIASTSAQAKIIIESPPDVPTNIESIDAKKLNRERGVLFEQFSATQSAIDQQADHCAGIEPGSAQASACVTEAQNVVATVRSYRANLKQFKADISQAVAWQATIANIADRKTPDAVQTVPSVAADTYKKTISISAKSISIKSIESSGDFSVVGADGRNLSDDEIANLADAANVRFVTGSDGEALLTLKDGSRIRVGSDSVFYPKSSDPEDANGKGSVMMGFTRGTLRWLHEARKELTETEAETRERLMREGKIRVAGDVIGVRGTEFDCTVQPDGVAEIRLYSGEVSLASKDGSPVILKAGQMITFSREKIGAVVPIPDEDGSQ